MVDATERLQVLLSQETNIYQTTDYLTRIHEQHERSNNGGSATADMEWEARSSMTDSSSAAEPSSPRKRKSLVYDQVNDVRSDHEQRGPSTTVSDRDGSKSRQGSSSSSSSSTAPTGGSGSNNSTTSNSSLINKHWREKICEWAYQVVDHFNLDREVVSIAMNHLDRYLGSFEGHVDKNLFQLLAMTCLYMSIKLNEYKHLLIPGSKSSMDTILQLSRGFFTLEEMEKMEFNVLQGLRWHVHPPTPQVFVKHFLFFLSIEEHEIHDLAQFMVELSIMDYFFVSYKPSEVALASLLNAIDRLCPPGTVERLQMPSNSRFLDIDSSAVAACRARLALIYAQANEPSPGINATGSTTPTSSKPVTTAVPMETRTVSPVSVMAAPHVVPSSAGHAAADGECRIRTTHIQTGWHA